MFLYFVILGLIVGSFLSAYTYRAPLDIPISKGRSLCPNCKNLINWYDNIPVFSFLFLHGKCRNCHKKISPRYPIIELSTAIIFTLVYLNMPLINANISWAADLPYMLYTIFYILIATLCLTVIITDLEHQIILDNIVFTGFFTTLFLLILKNPDLLFHQLLASFFSAFLLLSLNLITRGKGMGMGDVKFALFAGLVFGLKLALAWLFLAFILGSIIGIILIIVDHKKLKTKIAFGPFLALSFYIFMFYGHLLTQFIFPI